MRSQREEDESQAAYSKGYDEGLERGIEQGTNATSEKVVNELRDRVGELEEALRSVEWITIRDGGKIEEVICPSCFELKMTGHYPGCALEAALSGGETCLSR